MVRGSPQGTKAGLVPLTICTLSPADSDLRQSTWRAAALLPGVPNHRL